MMSDDTPAKDKPEPDKKAEEKDLESTAPQVPSRGRTFGGRGTEKRG